MKVVFLDRDGVINEFPGNGLYVTRVEDFHFIPKALDALKLLTDHGYHIFVISNQAGVGKGVFAKSELDRITDHMLREIAQKGAKVDGVYYCTCKSIDGCHCRKPRIGNVIKALASINRTLDDAGKAFFVGDTEGDIKTGKNAGCRTIFTLSGRETRERVARWHVRPDHIVEGLYDAVQFIIKEDPHPVRDSRRRAQKSR